MTGLNVQNKDLHGQNPIEREHVDNNAAVRNMLVNRGIYPETLPASEDTDKVKRRLVSDEKKVLKETKKSRIRKIISSFVESGPQLVPCQIKIPVNKLLTGTPL